MIRAVIDTNVLVSGLLRPSGNEAVVILAIHHGLVRPCFSEEILEEYASVLSRPKFSFPPDEIEALIATVRRNGEMFESAASSVLSPDPSDTKFVACAQAALADFIITGNRRDFPLPSYGRARVVGASEVVDQIAREI